MFSIEILPFGTSRMIVASHKSGLRLEILPDYGAALNHFSVLNREGEAINILDGYQTEDEPITTGALYKGVFLFPFPNRLKNATAVFNGQELHFPLNEPVRQNALHGLLYNRSFSIDEITASNEMAFIQLSYEAAEPEEGYPFRYRITHEFILTDLDGLTVKTLVTNLGEEPMPYGIGWHPYFKTGTPVNEWKLEMPSVNELEIDAQMIPTGTKKVYPVFDNPAVFGTTQLDTGFELLPPVERYQTRVWDPEKKLSFSVWQDVGTEGYRYLQVYSPPHRQSLAIEPMSCMANALQTGQGGLSVLSPGSSQSFGWGISLP